MNGEELRSRCKRRIYCSVAGWRCRGQRGLRRRNEKAVFDRFYEDDCAQGSRVFWMPDPSTHGWPLLAGTGRQLLTATGAPLQLGARWLCAWGDPPPTEAMFEQVRFRKTFSVWVLP